MVKESNHKQHHSVKINVRKCIGCVRCMQNCPTRAIRVKQGKAHINYNRCIDCGECLRVCPYNAVDPLVLSSADLNKFKFKVALPSPVLYSQFGIHVTPAEVLSVLQHVGFDHVYDEALVCEMMGVAIEEYLEDHDTPRPIISCTCPVVVRLIQRLFPSLCELIIPIEPPREIAGKNLRKEISERYGIPKEDIGIIHITPCAAKMVSINYPESMSHSFLNGAISIQEIYNKIMMKLKRTRRTPLLDVHPPISGVGIGWTIAGGEIRGLKNVHSVSVAGVYDTIRILEDVESGKLKNIQYLECLICPDGCVGGPLTVENRFIAKSNALQLIKVYGEKRLVDVHSVKRLYREKFFSFEHGITPKPFLGLDKDPAKAIEVLNVKEEVLKKLPKTDCGACGAPDCATLAEDIARGEAQIEDCIYKRR